MNKQILVNIYKPHFLIEFALQLKAESLSADVTQSCFGSIFLMKQAQSKTKTIV